MTTLHEALVAAFQRGNLDEARRLGERELLSHRGSPETHYILGLVHCRQGRLGAGIDLIKFAVEAEPDNAAFRVMLVRALVDNGRADEALEFATPPAGRGPPELALWHARAEAAGKVGTHEIAAEAWEVLCTARPTDWRAWNNFGEALAALEKWRQAAEALRRASGLKPEEKRIRRNLATALIRAHLHDEAARELQGLLETEPGDVAIHLTLARVFTDLGRSHDAIAELERAAALTVTKAGESPSGASYIGIAVGEKWSESDRDKLLDATQLDAIRDLALLFERTNRMDALRQLVEEAERIKVGNEALGYAAAALALRDGKPEDAKRLLAQEPETKDPVRWHRLMSKILDALGDSAAAFVEADQMNRSVYEYEEWRERAAAYRQTLRKLCDVVTRSWVDATPRLEPSRRRTPIFLVGFPRSGTTLLDTFLMGHSDAEVVEEMHMLGAAETLLGGITDLPKKSVSTLEQARHAYFEELDRHVDPDSGRKVVDKLPLNMLALPLICSLFPDAQIIFAQRHPCDCVLSGFFQSFVMNEAMASFLTIEEAADLYDAVLEMFTKSRSLLPLKVHTLVYEELVSEPRRALRPLVDFLGFQWNDRILDHRATARERGTIVTASYDQVTQPLDEKPSGRWRRYEKELEPVLPVLLPWAERLGYKD